MNRINEKKKYKKKNFKMSSDVKKYDICSSSGKAAIKGVCPTSKSEYFAKGTQPDKCTYHSGSSYSNSDYYYDDDDDEDEDSKKSDDDEKSDDSKKSKKKSDDSSSKKKESADTSKKKAKSNSDEE
jgi:penicillin-binding protein 1A